MILLFTAPCIGVVLYHAWRPRALSQPLDHPNHQPRKEAVMAPTRKIDPVRAAEAFVGIALARMEMNPCRRNVLALNAAEAELAEQRLIAELEAEEMAR